MPGAQALLQISLATWDKWFKLPKHLHLPCKRRNLDQILYLKSLPGLQFLFTSAIVLQLMCRSGKWSPVSPCPWAYVQSLGVTYRSTTDTEDRKSPTKSSLPRTGNFKKEMKGKRSAAASWREMECHSFYCASFYRMFLNGYPNTSPHLKAETVAGAESNISTCVNHDSKTLTHLADCNEIQIYN